jgi:hypothetical protein
MYAEFETETKAQEVLRLLQKDNLPKLRQQNRFFYFVDEARSNQNPRVVEIMLDFYINWAISEISYELWPVMVTSKMETIWERPTPAALGVAA